MDKNAYLNHPTIMGSVNSNIQDMALLVSSDVQLREVV